MKYLSALLTQASGKLGGAVAAKNRGGNYFRARVAPVQPRTVSQQNVRANLAAAAAAWKALTAAEIAGWNALAAQITYKDALGNSYKPSGIDLFVGCNSTLADNGEDTISTPPAGVPAFPAYGPLTAAAAAGAATFTVDTGGDAAGAGYVYEVRATPQLSPGISFIGQSKYRLLETALGTATLPLNIEVAYVRTFGTLVAGRKIGVQISIVQVASGFKTLAQSTTTLVSA